MFVRRQVSDAQIIDSISYMQKLSFSKIVFFLIGLSVLALAAFEALTPSGAGCGQLFLGRYSVVVFTGLIIALLLAGALFWLAFQPPEKTGEWLFRLSAVGFGVVIALVFMEVAIRVVIDPLNTIDDIIYANHEVIGFAWKPNFEFDHRSQRGNEFETNVFVTDSNGLIIRDGEPNVLDPDAHRILFIGDSFVFGGEVPDDKNMSELLEDRLIEETNETYQVINTGVSGYNAYNYYLSYLYYRDQFDPETVIVVFYAGNDILSRYNPDVYTFDEQNHPIALAPRFDLENYASIDYGTGEYELIDDIRETTNSRPLQVAKAIRERLIVSICQRAEEGNPTIERGPAGPVDTYRDSDDIVGEKNSAVFKDNYTPQDEAGIEPSIRPLLYLQEAVEADNRELLVIIVPRKAKIPDQGGSPLYEGIDEGQWMTAENPEAYIASYCEANGITCINALPIMRENSDRQLYWLYNIHLALDGHQLVADIAADYLLGN